MIKKFLISKTLELNKYIQLENNKIWFKTNTRVLYADTDAAGVIYHATYLRYFEIGRAELLRNFGTTYRDIEKQNIFHPIVHVEIDYHSPSRYDELLDIYVRPKLIETVKFTIEYKILNSENDKIIADGETVHCCTIGGIKPCPVDVTTKNLFMMYNSLNGS